MNFKVDERYNAVVIELKGNVMGGPDGANLLDKLRELKDDGKPNIVVDLSRVKFTKLITVFKHYESVDLAVESYEADPPGGA